MKITAPERKFTPVTLTIESEAEAALFLALIGPTSHYQRTSALEDLGYSEDEADDASNDIHEVYEFLETYIHGNSGADYDRYNDPITDRY